MWIHFKEILKLKWNCTGTPANFEVQAFLGAVGAKRRYATSSCVLFYTTRAFGRQDQPFGSTTGIVQASTYRWACVIAD